MGNLTKSKDRVRKHAEVFTPIHVVKQMCDLIDQEEDGTNPWALGKTWLEPACGNGVFIGEIVRRKLSYCDSFRQGLDALKDVYAIDIQPDNVQQAKCQALGQFTLWCVEECYLVNIDQLRHACDILDTNFIIGNFLKPETITIFDWKTGQELRLSDIAR